MSSLAPPAPTARARPGPGGRVRPAADGRADPVRSRKAWPPGPLFSHWRVVQRSPRVGNWPKKRSDGAAQLLKKKINMDSCVVVPERENLCLLVLAVLNIIFNILTLKPKVLTTRIPLSRPVFQQCPTSNTKHQGRNSHRYQPYQKNSAGRISDSTISFELLC